jgi:hypothetical protein
MEERPPIWRVAANILNKQSRTDGKEKSSRLALLRNGYMCLGLGLVLWYNLSNGKGT